VALCWDHGWAVLRRNAAHSLCRVCPGHALWPCSDCIPCCPGADNVAVSSSLVWAAAAAACLAIAAGARRPDGLVARSPVGWIAECSGGAALLAYPGPCIAAWALGCAAPVCVICYEGVKTGTAGVMILRYAWRNAAPAFLSGGT